MASYFKFVFKKITGQNPFKENKKTVIKPPVVKKAKPVAKPKNKKSQDNTIDLGSLVIPITTSIIGLVVAWNVFAAVSASINTDAFTTTSTSVTTVNSLLGSNVLSLFPLLMIALVGGTIIMAMLRVFIE